jgi:hypothetical protein
MYNIHKLLQALRTGRRGRDRMVVDVTRDVGDT